MWIEGREVAEYANAVGVDQLKKGRVYFMVSFFDDNLCVPELVPVVYIGESTDDLSFQYASSYFENQSSGSAVDIADTFRYEGEVTSVYTFDVALEALLVCSSRRKREGC